MPDWDAPFKLPKLTSEEYRKRKAAYVAKHGYTITIPGFEDIIHINVEKPVTIAEQKQWVKKNWDYFPPGRRDEIQYIKKRNTERFLNMLGSATPDVFRNHASLMTAMDDTQDALSTVACIGKVAARLAPRSIAGAIEGPVGWTLLASDLLNMAMMTQRGPMMCLQRKRAIDGTTELNPFNKKARLKRIGRIKRVMPTKGDVIQALQTTDQVFGYGITLGQLMNMPIEIIAGNVRRLVYGRRVTVRYPIPNMAHWYRTVKKLGRGIGLMWGTHHATDDNFLTSTLLGYNLMHQIDRAETLFDPIEKIWAIDKVEIRAPAPENLITREIYEEEGLNPDDFRGWPGVNKEWATLEEIHTAQYPIALDNFKRYCQRNKHNFMGMIGAMNAVEGSLVQMGNIEGEDAVEADYTATCKSIHTLLDHNYYFPEDVPQEKWDAFLSWLDAYDQVNESPTTPHIISYARTAFGINFSTNPPSS